jgi:hypothetical protein
VVLSKGVKRTEREADLSPTIVEVKKTWIYYLHSPTRLHGVVLSQLSTGTALSFAFTGLHLVYESPGARRGKGSGFCSGRSIIGWKSRPSGGSVIYLGGITPTRQTPQNQPQLPM